MLRRRRGRRIGRPAARKSSSTRWTTSGPSTPKILYAVRSFFSALHCQSSRPWASCSSSVNVSRVPHDIKAADAISCRSLRPTSPAAAAVSSTSSTSNPCPKLSLPTVSIRWKKFVLRETLQFNPKIPEREQNKRIPKESQRISKCRPSRECVSKATPYHLNVK